MRRFASLCLLLALAGCASEPPAPSWGPATLALVLDEPEGLRFVRHDPDRAVDQREQTLAKLPAVHGLAHVAFAPGRDEALLWRGKGYDDPPVAEGLWHVTWGATPKVEPMQGPGGGSLDDAGFDAQGRPTALVLDQPEPYTEPQKDAKGEFRMFEGKRYGWEPGGEGLKVLAHAFTWQGGAWRRSETVATTSGWDYGLGVKALKASQALAPRSNLILEGHEQLLEIKDPKRLAALAKLGPKAAADSGDGWQVVQGEPALYAWVVTGEFMHPTNRIALDVAGTPQAIGGLDAPPGEEQGIGPGLRTVALLRRGPLLLLADEYDGRHPRLVDLATRDLRFSSDRASAAVFWPAATPAAPASP